MERILNNEERIRRAEEIYNRRNNLIGRDESVEKITTFSFSKLFLKVLIFFNISLTIIAIVNKDFIFKEEFLLLIEERVGKIGYVQSIYTNIKNKIEEINTKVNLIKENGDVKTENSSIEYIENPIKILDENGKLLEESSSISYEKKIEEINNKTEFVLPLKGEITITSNFGNRTSQYANVSKYHTGIDFSANIGTEIIASTEGTVVEVSSEGDYGIHLKIERDEIITLYAHCSEILVKEGDVVSQGQIIAKTGNTGNTTGPHLHFEIRKNGECINPLEFLKI